MNDFLGMLKYTGIMMIIILISGALGVGYVSLLMFLIEHIGGFATFVVAVLCIALPFGAFMYYTDKKTITKYDE